MRRKNVSGINVVFDSCEVNISRKIAESGNCQVNLTDKGTVVKYFDLSVLESLKYYEREAPVYQITYPNPNIASYLDHQVTSNQAFLHLEYATKGDFSYIMATRRLNLYEVREAILDICSALSELHGKGVLHLDLRPENILVSNEGISKLCDFGSSLRADSLSSLLRTNQLNYFINSHTSISYRSPELTVKGPLTIGYWVDMWQLGCLLYTMIYYKPPFPHGFSAPVDLTNTPKMFKSVLEGLFDLRYNKRPTAAQVIYMLTPDYLLTGKLREKKIGFIEKLFIRSTKQLVSRILANDENLNVHEISRLIYKVGKEPIKIGKFLEVVNEKLSANVLMSLKVLALMHMYSFKVPVFDGFYGKLKVIVQKMFIAWNLKVAEKNGDVNEMYFAGIIRQYCRLFLLKFRLFEVYEVKFNWGNFVMESENIESVLEYLEFCIYLLLGVSFESVRELRKLRLELGKIFINEISIVVLIFTKAFKASIDFSNYRYIKFKKLYHQVKVLCEKKCYQIFLASLPDDPSLMSLKSYATAIEELFLTF